MKKVSEIREEAKGLYNKSSHYIVGTFVAVGCITAIADGILNIIGTEVGIGVIAWLGILFSPLEYGMIKASLMAYDHKARQVDTWPYTFAGLKQYFKLAIPFVGRYLVVDFIQACIIAIFVYLATNSVTHIGACLDAILNGESSLVVGENSLFVLTLGEWVGILLAGISGFILDAYFALSYYYVVEDNMGLKASLSTSFKHMRGHVCHYLLLRLSYVPYLIVVALIAAIINNLFQTLFQQLIVLLPQVPLVAFNVILVIISAFVTSLLSVMIYKVKESLAITIFYKEANKEA